MQGVRWIRVMMDNGLFEALSKEKKRRQLTWDALVQQALKSWMDTTPGQGT